MQLRETLTATLTLPSRAIVPCEDEAALVRVVPVRAVPPDPRVLGMLDETAAEVPAALRVVRHRLEARRDQSLRSVAVTSARDAEGKSTLAAQLALVLGEAQRARVLLVEASLHRPALARILGLRIPSRHGFSVQLADRMRGAIAPWTVLSVGPSLHCLIEDDAEPGFPGTLQSPHFRGAIDRLVRAYDWVVVDAPSVLGSGDANVVENAVDGVVVAARSRRSRGSDVRAALDQLGRRKVVGVVLWDR
jgi:Mrp family chromosome partitioning ATPase